MTIEAQLDRLIVAVEALLGIALRNASKETQDEVVRAATGQPVAAPQVNTSAQQPTQAPPSKARKPKPEPSTQAAPTSPPQTATAPATPLQAPPASPPPTTAEKTLLQTCTDQVIALANDFSRDEALAILAKRRGIQRCSELKPDEVQGVLDEATAVYQLHMSKKNSASLI
jgi:hypothetical protein